MFPQFLGIGAQRAATSWLYHNLNLHPQIWLPPKKEIHFFDKYGWLRPGLWSWSRDWRWRKQLKRQLVKDSRQLSFKSLPEVGIFSIFSAITTKIGMSPCSIQLRGRLPGILLPVIPPLGKRG